MEISDHSLRRVRRGASLCFWGYILLVIGANGTLGYSGLRVNPFYALGFVTVLGLITLFNARMGLRASGCALASAVLMTTLILALVFLGDRNQRLVVSTVALGASLAFQYLMLRLIAARCGLRRVAVELRYFLYFFASCVVVTNLMFLAITLMGNGEKSHEALIEFYVFKIAPTGSRPGIVTVLSLFILFVLLAVGSMLTLLRCYWFARDWARHEMRSRRDRADQPDRRADAAETT